MHFAFFMHFHKHYITSSINKCMFVFLNIVLQKSATTNPKLVLHQYYTQSKGRAKKENKNKKGKNKIKIIKEN